MDDYKVTEFSIINSKFLQHHISLHGQMNEIK